MPKPYEAPKAPVVNGKLAGTEKWVDLAELYSGGALWNNGTWVQRDIKGKPGQISNHAKGIAADLSYRRIEPRNKGVSGGRKKSLDFINRCLANYDVLGVMLVIDYWPQPLGRSWRCDRVGLGVVKPNHAEAWRQATVKTFFGAPGGDWWHVEITPAMANDPKAVEAAFKAVFEVSTTTP
jgi:hypothetical protein